LTTADHHQSKTTVFPQPFFHDNLGEPVLEASRDLKLHSIKTVLFLDTQGGLEKETIRPINPHIIVNFFSSAPHQCFSFAANQNIFLFTHSNSSY